MVFSITIKIKSIYKRKCLYWWVILWNHESSKTSSPPLILVISLVKDMAHPWGWGVTVWFRCIMHTDLSKPNSAIFILFSYLKSLYIIQRLQVGQGLSRLY